MAAAGTLARPSEEFGNDSRVETLWAMKAMEHAEVYFNVGYLWFALKDTLIYPFISYRPDSMLRGP